MGMLPQRLANRLAVDYAGTCLPILRFAACRQIKSASSRIYAFHSRALRLYLPPPLKTPECVPAPIGTVVLVNSYGSATQIRNIPTRRCLATFVPAYLVPPLVFVGLVLSLWAYKCLMMVIFQGKILYMPSVPPFSRSEQMEDYVSACGRVRWRQERIESLDGTQLTLCIGDCASERATKMNTHPKHLVLLYFHGNASSLPPRLPGLSAVLQSLTSGYQDGIRYTLIALSYRGYWTSAGRPSQPGIERDAAAALNYVHNYCISQKHSTKLVLWGQSIGAGVASNAVANLLDEKYPLQQGTRAVVDALILETPFTSVRNMLSTLYPQKWLPYRYLWPFLRSRWDTELALTAIGRHGVKLPILCLVAEKDEVVTAQHGNDIVALCKAINLDVKQCTVPGALHTEALTKETGRSAIGTFLRQLVARK